MHRDLYTLYFNSHYVHYLLHLSPSIYFFTTRLFLLSYIVYGIFFYYHFFLVKRKGNEAQDNIVEDQAQVQAEHPSGSCDHIIPSKCIQQQEISPDAIYRGHRDDQS